MSYYLYTLKGNGMVDYDTELRFEMAKAKVEQLELVIIRFRANNGEKDRSRLSTCVTKILRALRKQGAIQFFVPAKGFDDNTTEAQFLINKYGEVNEEAEEGFEYFYIKI